MPISNVPTEPSFIQDSRAETAHREHHTAQLPHHHSEQTSPMPSHAQHRHLHHRKLHGRQAESIVSAVAESASSPAVTEVIQTISIIQQVNVDEDGNTVGIITYTTSSEPSMTTGDVAQLPMPSSSVGDLISSLSAVLPSLGPDTTPSETGDIPATTTTDVQPTITDILSSISELPIVSALPTASVLPSISPDVSLSASTVPTASGLPVSQTSVELPAAIDTKAGFVSPILSINATAVASSSYTTFLSSTKSPSLSTSGSITSTTSIPSSTAAAATSADGLFSSLSSTSSSTFTFYGKFGTISSSETTAASYTSNFEASPSTTSQGGLIVSGIVSANTPVVTDSVADSSADSSNASADDPAPLTPPKVAGVVVGSLAGLAFFIILAFYILRHVKQRKGGAVRLSIGSQNLGLTGGASRAAAGAPMSEKHSRFLPVAAFMSKPKALASGSSDAGTSEAPSFVRISGRKLPSVLQHGGDGYGGPGDPPPIPQHLSQHISDSSFYADDTGYHGGTGDSGISTAVAGGAFAAAATAAGQRDRNLTSTPHSQQNQPLTPDRRNDYRNPFSSPSDPIDHLQDPYNSPMPPTREGAQRSTVVVHAASNLQRNQSHNAHISSHLSLSPEQPPISGNTESSGSTHYTSAQEYENMDHMLLRRPDALGRSHPSQDGSKGSRFREDV